MDQHSDKYPLNAYLQEKCPKTTAQPSIDSFATESSNSSTLSSPIAPGIIKMNTPDEQLKKQALLNLGKPSIEAAHNRIQQQSEKNSIYSVDKQDKLSVDDTKSSTLNESSTLNDYSTINDYSTTTTNITTTNDSSICTDIQKPITPEKYPKKTSEQVVIFVDLNSDMKRANYPKVNQEESKEHLEDKKQSEESVKTQEEEELDKSELSTPDEKLDNKGYSVTTISTNNAFITEENESESSLKSHKSDEKQELLEKDDDKIPYVIDPKLSAVKNVGYVFVSNPLSSNNTSNTIAQKEVKKTESKIKPGDITLHTINIEFNFGDQTIKLKANETGSNKTNTETKPDKNDDVCNDKDVKDKETNIMINTITNTTDSVLTNDVIDPINMTLPVIKGIQQNTTNVAPIIIQSTEPIKEVNTTEVLLKPVVEPIDLKSKLSEELKVTDVVEPIKPKPLTEPSESFREIEPEIETTTRAEVELWLKRPDPIDGCLPGLEYLVNVDSLKVKQVDIIKTRTPSRGAHFLIQNSTTENIYKVHAKSKKRFLPRFLFASKRKYELIVQDGNDYQIMCMKRMKMKTSNQRVLDVFDSNNKLIGKVYETKNSPHYRIVDEFNNLLYRIERQVNLGARGSQFEIKFAEGDNIAATVSVEKNSLMKKLIHANQHTIEFSPELDALSKALILAASILLDMVYFEFL